MFHFESGVDDVTEDSQFFATPDEFRQYVIDRLDLDPSEADELLREGRITLMDSEYTGVHWASVEKFNCNWRDRTTPIMGSVYCGCRMCEPENHTNRSEAVCH